MASFDDLAAQVALAIGPPKVRATKRQILKHIIKQTVVAED